MYIAIDPRVHEHHPAAKIGWILAFGDVLPSHPHTEELKKGLPGVLSRIGIDDATLPLHPNIAKWRAVYSTMGVKPSKYKSSVEALARRVLKEKAIWNVNSLVDCYNCVSVTTLLALGAHDAEKIRAGLTLRFVREGEVFYPLGYDEQHEAIATDPRQIAYCDEEKICTWLWNHRDTRLATVDTNTKKTLFIVDCAFEPEYSSVGGAMSMLAGHLEKLDQNVVASGVVSIANPKMEISL